MTGFRRTDIKAGIQRGCLLGKRYLLRSCAPWSGAGSNFDATALGITIGPSLLGQSRGSGIGQVRVRRQSAAAIDFFVLVVIPLGRVCCTQRRCPAFPCTLMRSGGRLKGVKVRIRKFAKVHLSREEERFFSCEPALRFRTGGTC